MRASVNLWLQIGALVAFGFLRLLSPGRLLAIFVVTVVGGGSPVPETFGTVGTIAAYAYAGSVVWLIVAVVTTGMRDRTTPAPPPGQLPWGYAPIPPQGPPVTFGPYPPPGPPVRFGPYPPPGPGSGG